MISKTKEARRWLASSFKINIKEVLKMVYSVRLGKPDSSAPRKSSDPAPRKPPLPWCIWTCQNGRQILVDVASHPIWERAGKGQPAKRADPDEYVAHICDRDQIHSPRINPRSDPIAMRRVENTLKEWGITP